MEPSSRHSGKYRISWLETQRYLYFLSRQIPKHNYVWGVPHGGTLVALLLQRINPTLMLVDEPYAATVWVEDIVDSGRTIRNLRDEHHYGGPVYSLIHRYGACEPSTHACIVWDMRWIIFPWEDWDAAAKAEEKRVFPYTIGEPK